MSAEAAGGRGSPAEGVGSDGGSLEGFSPRVKKFRISASAQELRRSSSFMSNQGVVLPKGLRARPSPLELPESGGGGGRRTSYDIGGTPTFMGRTSSGTALSPTSPRRDRRSDLFMEIMEEPRNAAAAWLDSIASDTAFIAANQHPTYHLLMILAACVDTLLGAVDLSWYTNSPERLSYSWAHVTRDVLTAVILALFAANLLAHHFKYVRKAAFKGNYRRDAHSAPAVLDLLSVTVMVVLLASAFGKQAPNGTHLAMACLFRVYRVVWMLALNPLYLQKASGTTESSVVDHAFVRSIKFVWVANSYETFRWLRAPLQEVIDHVVETAGAEYVDLVLFVTQTTPEQEASIEDDIAGTCLEDCVAYGRPDLEACVSDICRDYELGRRRVTMSGGGMEPDATVGVFYCGSESLAEELRGCIVNHPARLQGMPLIYGSESTIPA